VTDVDVIIAVHDPRRNVARAVGSALTSRTVRRVIVVCHNTPIDGISNRLGSLCDDQRVQLEGWYDGMRSPAGPFNHGLEIAKAQYTSVMGSDDELAEGAVDVWIHAASAHRAHVVIPPLRYAGGTRVATPPTRPLRTHRLDGVRDRLPYRTAPIGLVDRAQFGDLRFTEGAPTGEDLAYSARLWFSPANRVRVRGSAEYRIHDDAERVTFSRRPLGEELEAIRALISDSWARNLGDAERESLAVKLWRIPIFGAAHYRSIDGWLPGDRTALAALCVWLLAYSPKAPALLSRADMVLLEAMTNPDSPDAMIAELSEKRRRFATPRALLTRRLGDAARREAPLRFAAATWLALHGK
jgi:hypothetical protein